jgi:hypothetical protein
LHVLTDTEAHPLDILSKKTLTILRDENVSKAVDELLNERTTGSRTVELTNSCTDRSAGEARPGTRVRIRRIA